MLGNTCDMRNSFIIQPIFRIFKLTIWISAAATVGKSSEKMTVQIRLVNVM